MIDLILLFFILGVFLCLVSIALVVRAGKRMRVLGIADHVEITREKPHLPDPVIDDEKPVPFPVGNGKHLYLQPLKEYEFTRYMGLYSTYLLALHNRAAGLKFVGEGDSKGRQKRILHDWSFLAFDDKLRKLQLRLIQEMFLKNRDINPERVKIKDIKEMRIDKIVRLWQLLHDRNVNAVEDFTRSLMTSLSGRENVKAGSVSSGAASTTVPFGTPLFPEKFFGQREQQN